MELRSITVQVNAGKIATDVEPSLLIGHFLRGRAVLTGWHIGRDAPECGACTALGVRTLFKSTTLYICECVKFRVAPSARTANSLLLRPPFAPAAVRLDVR
jgi:aerobic-type carbon monoxide dehydrogenase small subunit (CoxS/CutS family)